MRAVDLIRKKRDGGEWNEAEIAFLIRTYLEGGIPDYQMSALLMAVYFRGMTMEETAHFTMEMARSGDRIDLSEIQGIKVDKHSTGGVGDKTTLVLAPLVAAAGVPVAKMSGRGLGHTGGTIDKLESIRGFNVNLEQESFLRQVNRLGLALVSQTGNLTPADKRLYALRDVTATVESLPLIASSVMSKKIAAGADAIVLDVKTGRGAFMGTVEQAIELARTMTAIGHQVGRRTAAIVSDMEQPLGNCIGNALEVREAIETLQGRGPADLVDLCLTLGSYMVWLAGKADDCRSAYDQLKRLLISGEAYAKFKQWIEAQGGDIRMIENPDLLPTASRVVTVEADRSAYIASIRADTIGQVAMALGAGRAKKDDAIDHSVGIRLLKKAGEPVKQGEPLVELHIHERLEESDLTAALGRIRDAISWSENAPEPRPLIHAVITE